jgi:hypothetical protein
MFLLLVCFLVLSLVGLTVMRADAERLVLDPLQRMLKIIVRCKSVSSILAFESNLVFSCFAFVCFQMPKTLC